MDSCVEESATVYQLLFQKVMKEVKSFVTLMHDAVIRFYKLEVKVGM